ncbi:MAG TPA: YcnI family protein [Chloroflexota bacterium]|nr:YcnI family protein [Chloroflexota bacterium]
MKARPALCSALVAVLLAVGSAAAHVTVQPPQAVPNASQIFTVRVPTEKDEPTVRVRVEFPNGLTVSRFQPKPGWTRTMDRDSSGRITAVTWSGGRIEPAEFEDFIFQARTPEAAGKLAFRALQTYLSGETVEWVDAESGARPAAIVEVRAAAGAAGAADDHGQTVPATGAAPAPAATVGAAGAAPAVRPAATAGGVGMSIGSEDVAVSAGASDLPLFVAIAAVALGLISIALSAVALARNRPVGQSAV